MTLRALFLAVALLMGRGAPAAVTVDAVAESDATELEAALLAVYGARESSWQTGAVGDAGRSCGTWQQACARVAGLPERDRVRLWLYDLRHSSLASVDSSPSRARGREALAVRLLSTMRGR